MTTAANEAAFERELCRRIQEEYLSAPVLRLTAAQAARLWSIDAGICRCVLDRLVDEAFLRCDDGLYMLADCDPLPISF